VSFRGKQRKESRLNPSRNQAKDHSSYPSKSPRFFFAAIFQRNFADPKNDKKLFDEIFAASLYSPSFVCFEPWKTNHKKKQIGNSESFSTQTSQLWSESFLLS